MSAPRTPEQRREAMERALVRYMALDLDMGTERAVRRAVPLSHAVERAADNLARFRALHVFGGVTPEEARSLLEACGYAPDLRASSGGAPSPAVRSGRVH